MGAALGGELGAVWWRGDQVEDRAIEVGTRGGRGGPAGISSDRRWSCRVY